MTFVRIRGNKFSEDETLSASELLQPLLIILCLVRAHNVLTYALRVTYSMLPDT
jgi:hypothetical protein